MSKQDCSLVNALSLLKEGKTFFALKMLQELLKLKHNSKDPEYLAAIQNYQLALNLLFDRKLASAEELIQQEDEISSSIVFLNLSNLLSDLEKTHSHSNKNLKKKSDLFFDLVEKWALKVFTIIKSTELRKRHLERRFTEVFTSFSIISNLFLNYFIPLRENFYGKKYDSKSLMKTIQTIYKEFSNFYLKEAEKKLDKNDIIETHHILTKWRQIVKLIDNNSKYKSQIVVLSKKNAEKAADFEITAGKDKIKKKEFQEAIFHFRNAHFQYKVLNLNSKQKHAKDDFLKATISQVHEEISVVESAQNQHKVEENISTYHRCIDKLEKINASQELIILKNKFAIFQTHTGDNQFDIARLIPTDSIENIERAKDKFSNAERYYVKAANSRKVKEVRKIIQRLSKTKMKFLQKNVHKAKKAKNRELEFLLLEELHMICYEIDNTSKVQEYARQLEKLRKKIDLRKVEQIREQTLMSKPWIKQDYQKMVPEPKKIPNSNENQGRILAQTVKQPISAETIAFFDPSNNFNDQTYFTQRITQANPTQKKIATQSEELTSVYKIVKKFNSSQYLTNADIQYLISFGANLPQDIYYYHKFAKSLHQFYVHISKSNIPKILMIPTRNLIKRQAYLGTLAYDIGIFIPTASASVLSTNILKDHILFAINHPNWEPIMEGFQYSTLDCYFYFLHACRLLDRKAQNHEIAKYINSSAIAEFLNIPTDRLEKYLIDFQNVTFFEEIMCWSDNPNFQLFFIGLFFLREKEYSTAASIWCMMIVG